MSDDRWVVVQESFLTENAIGDTVPRQLATDQFLLRVNNINEEFLFGKRRYTAEELPALTADYDSFLSEDEKPVIEQGWDTLNTTYPDSLTEVYTYILAGVTTRTTTITYTNTKKNLISSVVKA